MGKCYINNDGVGNSNSDIDKSEDKINNGKYILSSLEKRDIN